MKISAVTNQYYTTPAKAENKPHNAVTDSVHQDTVQSNYLHFTGWFSRKKKKDVRPFEGDENGMSGNDYTVSFKVADILHRLDDRNILVIGQSNGAFVKGIVGAQLTKDESKLERPKSIENVYMVNYDTTSPIIIQKREKDEFYIYGSACNLTNPDDMSKRNWNDSLKYHFGNTASYGDVVEFENGLKLKFLHLPKESNVPMYDAKYPVESFFTKGPLLEGGIVLNDMPEQVQLNSDGEIESESKFGRSIPYRTFDDIAGMDDSIEFMKRKLMFPIMYPNAFKDDLNHGIILYGPTGTGKTLLALATIGEIKKRQNKNVHFVKINSRDLEQEYVGVSEKKWRAVFKELQNNQPAVLFIDEIDALMQNRNTLKDNTNNSQTSIVAQLLQSIDELEKTNAQVWIIGATNRPNAIDPAIKRSGRLGEMKEVKRPDEEGCRKILDLYLKKKNVSNDFDRDNFAKECYRLEYTGADIAQIVTEARNKMYDRCGITEKMNNGTYKDSDLKGLQYSQEDFDEALRTQQINKEIKRKIGFNK